MRNLVNLAAGGALLFSTSAAWAGINLGNVVCLGDSLTEGKNYGGGGYRQFLQNDLTALNYTYDFVGKEDNGLPANFTNYSNGMLDPNHEGFGSFTISNLTYGSSQEGHSSAAIGTELANDATTNPDGSTDPVSLILLMIGTNDMLQNSQSAPSDLNLLINTILSTQPSAQLIVASVPPVASVPVLGRIQNYDAAIANMVAGYEEQGKNVRFADVYSSMTPSQVDPADGVHPLPSGYQQIAQVWAEAIGQTNVNVSNGNVTIPVGTVWTAGTLFVNNGGTAIFQGDSGASFENLSVTVPTGSVLFQSTQHLAALNIGYQNNVQETTTPNGQRSILITANLIDNGTLDLTDNMLDVQNGNLFAITAQIENGFISNSSTGSIISSTVAADSTHLTTLGIILNNVGGAAIYGSGTTLGLFDGTNPAASDVLVRYTYYGDANLDGKIDGSDYSRIDNGYFSKATGWYNGDFNYDGVVNGSDYTLMDNAFNQQGTQLTAEIAGPSVLVTDQIAGSSLVDFGELSRAVPEPDSLAALMMISLGLLSRRRMIAGLPVKAHL